MRLEYLGYGNYYLWENFYYFSERYQKRIFVPEGNYDGASGAPDVCPECWLVHDAICNDPHWLDGDEINAWQAAQVLRDILRENGHWFRAFTWKWSTWLVGCKKAKQNGWF